MLKPFKFLTLYFYLLILYLCAFKILAAENIKQNNKQKNVLLLLGKY